MAQTAEITNRYPLPVLPQLRFDLTGKASQGLVVCEDWFADGMDGWVPLSTPDATVNSDARGAVQWDSRGALGSGSIIARTADAAANSGGQFAVAMMIKRLSNIYGGGVYLAEFYASVHNSYADLIRPRSFTFGLDTATVAGVRNLFGLDYNIVTDESGTPTPAWVWTIQTSVGSQNLGTFRAQTNENKDLPIYVAIEVDTVTGQWRGVNINGVIRAGTLAANPDNTLKAYTAGDGVTTLDTFTNGLNPYIQVSNRSNATKGAAEAKLHFHRLTYLGVSGS